MAHQSKKQAEASRSRPWPIAAGLALAVLTIVWIWRRAAGGDGWSAAALRSRGFITHAIIVAGAVALLAIICGALFRVGARARRARAAGAGAGEDGVAMIEFALVLPIALMLVLILAQSGLLMIGHLTVQYAAYCAVRSAIVWVPMGLASFSDEDNNVIHSRWQYSKKLGQIKDAAVWAVLPLSASTNRIPESGNFGLVDGIEKMLFAYDEDPPLWVRNLLSRKLYYANNYTEVWLDSPEEGDTYGEKETLNAHVKHTFYLSIPYANRLYTLVNREDGVRLTLGPNQYGMVMYATSILLNEGVRDHIDPEEYPR